MIRSDYRAPTPPDYAVVRCLWIHQEAAVSWALFHDPSRMRSRMLGSISETAEQVVNAPLGRVTIERTRMLHEKSENSKECLERAQERWEAERDMFKGMAAAKRMPITIIMLEIALPV